MNAQDCDWSPQNLVSGSVASAKMTCGQQVCQIGTLIFDDGKNPFPGQGVVVSSPVLNLVDSPSLPDRKKPHKDSAIALLWLDSELQRNALPQRRSLNVQRWTLGHGDAEAKTRL